MKRYVHVVASGVCLVLLAGCSKTETPAATTASPPPAKPAQEAPSTASTPPPPPPMPPANPPAGETSSGPKPGQVNDHSNPEFKKGGNEDTAK